MRTGSVSLETGRRAGEMADALVLRALRGNAKHLDLSGKKLRRVPKAVGRLFELNRLQLKNNLISDLPAELQALNNVRGREAARTGRTTHPTTPTPPPQHKP
ncbi:hypothetical protein chiPu_0023498, partial [Chiloscyllium punctatum]|nr:hypothetical protein [Chiloscyllium punctatum]